MRRDKDYFKRHSSGLFVPISAQLSSENIARADQESLAHLKGLLRKSIGALKASSEGIALAVQMATVIILYLTLTKTVIPIQQKESLAEQVAKLEKDKSRILTETKHIETEKVSLSRELRDRRAQLTRLEEKSRSLYAEKERAELLRQESEMAESEAQVKLQVTKAAERTLTANLMKTKWRFLGEDVSWELFTITNEHRLKIIENLRSDYDQPGFIEKEFELYKSAWPNFEKVSMRLASKVRSLKSIYYSETMAKQYADFLVLNAKNYDCKQLSASEFNAYVASILEEGRKKAASDMDRSNKYLEEHGFEMSDEEQRKMFKSQVNLWQFQGYVDMRNKLADDIQKCFANYGESSVKFFNGKVDELP